MKKLLFFATAIVLMASCANDEYTGEDLSVARGEKAIGFGMSSKKMTRTTSTDAAKLEYKFKVFGVKTPASGSDQRVFATSTTGVTPYDVWFVDATGNTTASNSSNWEYVGASGTTYGTNNTTDNIDGRVTLSADQTIKYWDYSATEYNFQAWTNVDGGNITPTAIDKNTMTISGSAADLAKFWIADLETISQSNNTTTSTANAYGGKVQFTFRKAAAKVRLGIYETIPGYVVKDVKFYYNSKSSNSTTNAYLDGKFVGASTGSQTFNVTYAGTAPKKAIITPNSPTDANTTYFDFGSFDSSTSLGTSSSSPTWANASASANNYYINVLPNTTSTNIAAMTLTADYTLYNSASGETILVSGATAVVPATYMEWKPNYAYTYIFKISDNTNGSTGQSVNGLYPITLDAVVVDAVDGTQETITTVSTPSITCYQDGVAISSGFDASKDIVVSVSEASTITVKELTGSFDYGKTYDQQSYNTTFGTSGTLTLSGTTEATFANANITSGKTYVIKAVATADATKIAYFVLKTNAAETGPTP